MYTIEISYCEFIIIRHTPIFMDFLDKTHQFSIAGVIIQFSFKPRKFGTTNLNEFTIIISFHLEDSITFHHSSKKQWALAYQVYFQVNKQGVKGYECLMSPSKNIS